MTICNGGAGKFSEGSQLSGSDWCSSRSQAKNRIVQLTRTGYVSPDSSLVDRTETRWGFVLDELGSWTQAEQKGGFRFLTKRPLSCSSFVVCK